MGNQVVLVSVLGVGITVTLPGCVWYQTIRLCCGPVVMVLGYLLFLRLCTQKAVIIGHYNLPIKTVSIFVPSFNLGNKNVLP